MCSAGRPGPAVLAAGAVLALAAWRALSAQAAPRAALAWAAAGMAAFACHPFLASAVAPDQAPVQDAA